MTSSTDPNAVVDEGQHIDAPELRLFVTVLFFIFGGITSLNDVIIPKLINAGVYSRPLMWRINVRKLAMRAELVYNHQSDPQRQMIGPLDRIDRIAVDRLNSRSGRCAGNRLAR